MNNPNLTNKVYGPDEFIKSGSDCNNNKLIIMHINKLLLNDCNRHNFYEKQISKS